MVGPRTPEQRLADLEADREERRAEVASLRSELDAERAAVAELRAEHDAVTAALRRGRLPASRPGGREIEVQPRLTDAERHGLAWVARQRAGRD